MFNLSQKGKTRSILLNEASPLRRLDPRSKLFVSIALSLAVMLPLDKLIIFIGVYIIFIAWARLLLEMARQTWRLRWILLFLFVIDWWLVSFELAAVITLRLILLSGVFALFFSTTSTNELSMALESLRIPYRFAFSINLAFQSIGLLQEEWQAIREAQQSRGILVKFDGIRQLIKQVNDLIALTVPAIVLATRRAWAITEAAYSRGFDSPQRVSYYQLQMNWIDWLFIGLILAIMLTFIFWR
ncbi:MAG: energy-coupling factor transporter transmembrane protein EcfT [Anaerolineaceae bacterium]|nr:energy-coupling factor transporter transmembrane protein EcfT [Anaerolineaceae bacterium]